MLRGLGVLLSLVGCLAWSGAVSAAPEDGAKSNVSVRGLWSIVVLDHDGSLVSRTDFENAYVPTRQLPGILARDRCFLGMGVDLTGGGGLQSPCVNDQGEPFPCYMFEADYQNWAQLPELDGAVYNLGATEENDSLVLRGSVVVGVDGGISLVASRLVTHRNECGTPPGDFDIVAFTAHTLPQVIPVSAGQQVQVTVTISFGAL